MNELSRVELYRTLLAKNDLSPKYRAILELNIRMLEGIEGEFLTTDWPNEKVDKSLEQHVNIQDLARRLRRNMQEYNVDEILRNDHEEQIGRFIGSILQTNDNDLSMNVYGWFNDIIRKLADINNNVLGDEYDWYSEPQANDLRISKVFLSHAYKDKLYTYALYDYFNAHEIFLYIDWMNEDKEDDGMVLKRTLTRNLSDSDQLLLLRTPADELAINRNKYLRPWCAWELGNFYSEHGGNDKYVLNLYSIDGYDDIHLHGMRVFTGISHGKLFGPTI